MNRRCHNTICRANTAGTRQNRATHQKAYLRFCQQHQFNRYPVDDWRLCQFVQHLFAENKKPQTVCNYMSSIRVLQQLAGMQNPVPQIHYRMMVEGIEKECTDPVRQADPITNEILLKLFPFADCTSEPQAVAWTSLLVGFNLILRISNLGPATRSSFDPHKNLL